MLKKLIYKIIRKNFEKFLKNNILKIVQTWFWRCNHKFGCSAVSLRSVCVVVSLIYWCPDLRSPGPSSAGTALLDRSSA